MRNFTFTLVALLTVSFAVGQELTFLVPSSFSARPNQAVSLTRTQTERRVSAALICGIDFRENFESDLKGFSLEGPNSALAAIVYDPAPIQNSKLISLFGLKSSSHSLSLVATSIAAIAGQADASVLLSRLGLPTELRLITSPVRATGADVALRFYGHNQMVVVGAPVIATHLASGKTQRLETDAAGIVNLASVKAGVWRVAAAQLYETTLFVATTTFEVTR